MNRYLAPIGAASQHGMIVLLSICVVWAYQIYKASTAHETRHSMHGVPESAPPHLWRTLDDAHDRVLVNAREYTDAVTTGKGELFTSMAIELLVRNARAYGDAYRAVTTYERNAATPPPVDPDATLEPK